MESDKLRMETASGKSLNNNNRCSLVGVVVKEPEISHSVEDMNYFLFRVRAALPEESRDKGACEIIVVTPQEKILAAGMKPGDRVAVQGRRGSHFRQKPTGGKQLEQFVYAQRIDVLEAETQPEIAENRVYFDGYVCRGGDQRDLERIFVREHPDIGGRQVCELQVEVLRKAGYFKDNNGVTVARTKPDFIRLVFEEPLASLVAKEIVKGDRIRGYGFMRSRFYQKTTITPEGQTTTETREAHEVVPTEIIRINESDEVQIA